MRIHTPQIIHTNEMVRLSARVETGQAKDELPEDLWFEVPAEFEHMLHPGIEGFVAALLPYAMYLGEEIIFDEPISPWFAYHVRLAGQVMNHLNPNLFHPVEFRHGGYLADPPARAPGVGMMFSGGVDSFYTLLGHRPAAQPVPGYAVTHGFFLFRFDLADYEIESYRKSTAIYQALFERLGMTLIPGSFNARDFRPQMKRPLTRDWLLRTHPFGLIGFGLALSGGLGRMLLASSQLFDAYGETYGGDFEIQTSLSTEWLEVIHDGIATDRAAKTIALADWPETYDTLRVCWWDPDGVQNCGRCPKCIRTMTTLEAIGRLDPYTTFPKPYDPGMILKGMGTIGGSVFLPGIRKLALKNGRRDLVRRLSLVILIAGLRAKVKALIRIFVPGFRRMDP